jgi:hypothetical protein
MCRNIQINVYHRREGTTTCCVKALNFIAAVANIGAYVGFILLAVYPTDSETVMGRNIHTAGSYTYFVLASAYDILQTALLWQQKQYPCFLKIIFTLIPVVVVPVIIAYAVKQELTILEWFTVAIQSIYVGLFSILFGIDPVEDELRDFFCCCCRRQGGTNCRRSQVGSRNTSYDKDLEMA